MKKTLFLILSIFIVVNIHAQIKSFDLNTIEGQKGFAEIINPKVGYVFPETLPEQIKSFRFKAGKILYKINNNLVSYMEIPNVGFDTVFDVGRIEYALCRRSSGHGIKVYYFLNLSQGEVSEEFLVDSYLRCVKVDGNIYFYSKKMQDISCPPLFSFYDLEGNKVSFKNEKGEKEDVFGVDGFSVEGSVVKTEASFFSFGEIGKVSYEFDFKNQTYREL